MALLIAATVTLAMMMASLASGASYGAVLSTGFTSDMVLAQAPARAAIYGLVFAAGSDLPRVSVSIDGGAALDAVVERGSQGPSRSANACDKACFDAGHLAVGGGSCCNAPRYYYLLPI